MGHSNPKTNATEQRAQIVARRASEQDEIPSVGEEAKEAVFDDDSMFNSADRQSAILQGEQARRAGRRKKETRTALTQTGRRKAA